MIRKAIVPPMAAAEVACTVPAGSQWLTGSSRRSTSGSIRWPRAGSPTQPRPRLATVMPSWVAAM